MEVVRLITTIYAVCVNATTPLSQQESQMKTEKNNERVGVHQKDFAHLFESALRKIFVLVGVSKGVINQFIV